MVFCANRYCANGIYTIIQRNASSKEELIYQNRALKGGPQLFREAFRTWINGWNVLRNLYESR